MLYTLRTTMKQGILFILTIFITLVHCYLKPPSEPFVLAVYDPEYEPDHILHSNIERVGYNKTKVLLSKEFDPAKTYLEGRILSNSSFKIDNLKGMFIRVDKYTNRLKLCPNGVSSEGFSIKKGMLYHNGETCWTACYDSVQNASYIYQGNAEDNKKYCCDDNSKEIILRTLGKYDSSGALPNYPDHVIEW
ncbi:hypothetical protein SBY92_003638 [Candida maltosa Xu316]